MKNKNSKLKAGESARLFSPIVEWTILRKIIQKKEPLFANVLRPRYLPEAKAKPRAICRRLETASYGEKQAELALDDTPRAALDELAAGFEDLQSCGLRPSQTAPGSVTLLDALLRGALSPPCADVIQRSSAARRSLALHGTLTWRSLRRLPLRSITLRDGVRLLGSAAELDAFILDTARSAASGGV